MKHDVLLCVFGILKNCAGIESTRKVFLKEKNMLLIKKYILFDQKEKIPVLI